MKNSNNTLQPHSTDFKNKQYVYIDQYRHVVSKMLSLPIKEALHKRKMTLVQLHKELNETGLYCSYVGLQMALSGFNYSTKNMDYLAKIYFHLSLPCPDVHLLCETHKNFKAPTKKSKNLS